jgi:tetratricopeptide (TPR) repeat protein
VQWFKSWFGSTSAETRTGPAAARPAASLPAYFAVFLVLQFFAVSPALCLAQPAPSERKEPLVTSAAAKNAAVSESRDGIFHRLVNKVLETAATTTATYVLLLFAFLLLLGVGWTVPDVLRYVLSNRKLKPFLWTSLRARLAARAGWLFFSSAAQAQAKSNLTEALAAFGKGKEVIEAALREAETEHVDPAPLRRLLDDRKLASLHSAAAWSDAPGKDTAPRAIAAATRALELDSQQPEARIARGWAKLTRNQQGDVAEAEADFDAAIRIGQQKTIRYLWALYGRAEALRMQGEFQKAVDEYTKLEASRQEIPDIIASRAAAYHSLGKWQACVEDLTWVLSKNEHHRWAAYRADALRLMGCFQEAIDECDRIIQYQPDHEQACYVAGSALLELSRQPGTPEATRRELLERALKRMRTVKDSALKNQRPVAADVYNKLGEIASILDRNEEAQHWFTEARNTTRSAGISSEAIARAAELVSAGGSSRLNAGWARMRAWSLTRDKNELALADKEFSAAVGVPGCTALAYSGRSWVRYWQHSTGNATLDEALTFSRVAMEHDSKLGLAYYIRGWILIAKGQYAEAKTEFSAAIDLGFSSYDAWLGLAETDSMLLNHEAAATSYRKAIAAGGIPSTEAWRPHYGHGQAQAALTRWSSALDDYRIAIKYAINGATDPHSFATLYANVVWACYELGRDSEMEDAFRRAVELGSKIANVQLQLGGVRLYTGKYHEAVAFFANAIALDPDSSIGYVNRGLTYIYTGDLDAAMLDLDAAIGKDGKEASAWHTRGWARIRQKDWSRAKGDLDKAITLLASEPFSFQDRALARWWLQDGDGALEDLERALELKTASLSANPRPRLREDAVTWGATAQDWSQAVDRKPKDPVARLGRGVSRWLCGDLPGAESDLSAARGLKRARDNASWALEQIRKERLDVAAN